MEWKELLKKFPSRSFRALQLRVVQLKNWRKRGTPIARSDLIDEAEVEGDAREGEGEGGAPAPFPSTRTAEASGELWVRYLLDPVRFDGQYVTDPVSGQAIREMLQSGLTVGLYSIQTIEIVV